MNIIIKQITLIGRIDQLIRLRATGPPEALASRLEISRAKLFRTIDIMKTLNAPIEYDFTIQSYIYIEAVEFRFGFYIKDLPPSGLKNIK